MHAIGELQIPGGSQTAKWGYISANRYALWMGMQIAKQTTHLQKLEMALNYIIMYYNGTIITWYTDPNGPGCWQLMLKRRYFLQKIRQIFLTYRYTKKLSSELWSKPDFVKRYGFIDLNIGCVLVINTWGSCVSSASSLTHSSLWYGDGNWLSHLDLYPVDLAFTH